MTAVQTPWDPDPDPVQPTRPSPALPGSPLPQRKPRGRPAPARPGTGAPPWPAYHLVVTGPAAAVQAFAAAARGPGIVPWAHDARAVEDWVFDLAAAQPPRLRSLDIEGCRVLARQFRDRFERHHSRAATKLGQLRRCPLDLHALWPVPDALLRLGPADPAALAWMAEHWGVVDGLRQVVERPDLGPGRRLPRGHAWVSYGFFTGEGTALSVVAPMVARLGTRLGAQWPALRFVLRPGPD